MSIESLIQVGHPALRKHALDRAKSFQNRVADAITAFAGSMNFVYVHVALFTLWMLFLEEKPWPTLTLVVSLEAIFLSTFILISQNQENRVSDRRSQLDLQINLLTEQENTKMLRMLRSIADKVGADVSGDPEVAVLEQATQPENLVGQLERAEEAVDALDTPAAKP